MTLTATVKALPLNVFRDAGSQVDCTNGGVSSTHTRLHLVGYVQGSKGSIEPIPEGIPTHLDPEHHAPVVLHARSMMGTYYAVSLVPLAYHHNEGTWRYEGPHMAGGNYATGDSRLSSLIAKLTGNRFYGAVAIHDRSEH